MSYLDFCEKNYIHLNKQQEEAVRAVEGPVLLLAVPGGGKTTVLINRLGYMIYECGIKPEKILTVTYTKAATRDMEHRFEQLFGTDIARRLDFRTINSFSQNVLYKYGEMTGKQPFAVVEGKDQAALINEVYISVKKSFPTENDIKEIALGIAYAKNMRLSGDEIKKLDSKISSFSMLYESYQRSLRNHKLMDFDDQMVYALTLLEKVPEILQFYQNKYEYICVDEAQDTSKIQHDIIKLLAAKSGNIFMVGDEDQSIYGFRAAYPEALVNFESTYPGAKVLLMESNYRSSKEIVEAADKFIQNNKNRHKKHMLATGKSVANPANIKVNDISEQYHYLLNVAKNCNKETAVLYRNNENALPLINLLDKHGISYRLKESELTFFTHPVVTDICDFIRLALNPYDGETFLRIYYKMGLKISKARALYVAENNNYRTTIMDDLCDQDHLFGQMRDEYEERAVQFRDITRERPDKAIRTIVSLMGYGEYMDSRRMDSEKAETLKAIAAEEKTIKDFLNRLDELKEMIAQGCGDPYSDFILSTIHSSKGLEYDAVYLMDMKRGILPSVTSAEDNDLYEEERRLYYVGMTRAQNELNIFTFGDRQTSEFSRFVFK